MTFESLTDFVGQDSLKEQLRVRMEVAAGVGKPIPHILLCGPPEIGKQSFARAVAHEMLGVRIHVLPCSPATTKLDFIAQFSSLESGDIVILEEPSHLGNDVQSFLAETLAHNALIIKIGAAAEAKRTAYELPPFTLIATTSKSWRLPEALRRWFIALEFEPYALSEIAQILSVLGAEEGLTLDQEAAMLMAGHCRGTPGNAGALLKRIRRHYGSGVSISKEGAALFLNLLGFDQGEHSPIALADRLRVMSGVEFEEFVARLFGNLGYSAELTPTSGDHGVDILIRKAGQAGAVQCKRWEDPVGEPVVRDFLGSMMGAGVTVGYIAATSAFTEQAQEFAQKHGIHLLDLDRIIEMAGQT
jgi:Holliday junction DNA helicase RuvB